MNRFVTLFFACLVASSAYGGTPVDQSQTQFEKENDWTSGTAQSFTAGCDGLLKAIRLPVLRNSGERSLTLELRHVDANDIPTGPLLTSGTLAGSAFAAGIAQWYAVELNPPYEQAEGERLSFTVELGPSGDPYGWLEFGQSSNNPYSGGLMYYQGRYGPSGWTYDEGHLDFAFQTLAVPKPELSIAVTNGNLVRVSIPESHTDCVYRLEFRTNLLSGAWSNCTITTGTQSELLWEIPISLETNQAFFRITTEESTN